HNYKTFIFILTGSGENSSVLLYSLFSWGHLRGNVTFSWEGPGTNVSVEVSVESTSETGASEPQELNWAIHDLPLRFDLPQRCDVTRVGKKIIDLSKVLGPLTLPSVSSQSFTTDQLNLVGEGSIFGRSILISGSKAKTCGNIQGVGGEDTYEARFYSPVGGSIWFRTWTWHVAPSANNNASKGGSGTEIVIIADVFNTFDDDFASSSHDWNLYITDILDDESTEFRSSCNFLNNAYDFVEQNACQDGVCSYGDFTTKFGKLSIPSSRSRVSTKLYHSPGKPLLNLSGARQLYVGIEDAILKRNVYACARLRRIKPKKTRAIFSSDGVFGKIYIEQSSVFGPSELTLDLQNLREMAGGFHVHELPIKAPIKPGESTCPEALGHYNPYKVDPISSPAPGMGSHDQYELGDLSGKHGMLLGVNSISATVIDHNLPLFGPRSVNGRSIVIHKDDGSRWVCANLRLVNTDLIRAVATFRYPLVGEIVMEQERDDPFSDTTVIVGPLLYSDGSHNDTSNHDWFINENIPNKDFYNWTQRCVSAGPHYNPYKISTSQKVYRSCGTDNTERCEVGDMSGRHGTLRVAGSFKTASKTRKVLTDKNLPLSGPFAILSHSFVIEDKNAPKHRGNRMACTGIFRRFRYKGVVNKWQSSDRESEVKGKVEFIQDTPFDITNTEVDLQGLKRIASGYHVHMVPVVNDLTFPCAASSLYGHFNPLNATDFPAPNVGTDDQYESGDLSGSYNDSNLQLFGVNSILGRSVLIHKQEQSERWFCGSIGWGYAPSEARQVAAIASFHHPKGFAWGYIRLTRGHNWSVFVNPVGVDAAVKFFQSRCVAAGYRWNPFLIQLAHPNDRDYYDKQCTPEYPLRCDAGDISGRLGPIDVGDKRYVFMDSNLPLSGEHSAMGKAIVVHNEQGRVENFACANILPDEDIVKWANVKRTGRFSESIFMYDMRKMLNAPEWFLAIDYQTIKTSSDRKCVTFKIFFMGPFARQLELDFSRLLAGGILEKPTIEIPGEYPDPKRDKKVSYRACGGIEDEDLEKLSSKGGKQQTLTKEKVVGYNEVPKYFFFNSVAVFNTTTITWSIYHSSTRVKKIEISLYKGH
ncbi:Superoxide dismutase [Cu-Zn], partial [Armadillidium vulgare]